MNNKDRVYYRNVVKCDDGKTYVIRGWYNKYVDWIGKWKIFHY